MGPLLSLFYLCAWLTMPTENSAELGVKFVIFVVVAVLSNLPHEPRERENFVLNFVLTWISFFLITLWNPAIIVFVVIVFWGWLSNQIVMQLNGGLMPVCPIAIMKIKGSLPKTTTKSEELPELPGYCLINNATWLKFFTDRIRCFRSVISFGDIAIIAGLCLYPLYLLWNLFKQSYQ